MDHSSLAHQNTAPRKSPNAGKKRVEFKIEAPAGSEISVAGTFNNWKPGVTLLRETKAGQFRRTLYLPRGRYEYKFVIDGAWTVDPLCDRWTSNEIGTLNSILEI
jgi:1,4-alpha-glucan branching enzyme